MACQTMFAYLKKIYFFKFRLSLVCFNMLAVAANQQLRRLINHLNRRIYHVENSPIKPNRLKHLNRRFWVIILLAR